MSNYVLKCHDQWNDQWNDYWKGIDFNFRSLYTKLCKDYPEKEVKCRLYLDKEIIMTFTKWTNEPKKIPTKKVVKIPKNPRSSYDDIMTSYHNWLTLQPPAVQRGETGLCEICRNAPANTVNYYSENNCGTSYCLACYAKKLRTDLKYIKNEGARLNSLKISEK